MKILDMECGLSPISLYALLCINIFSQSELPANEETNSDWLKVMMPGSSSLPKHA